MNAVHGVTALAFLALLVGAPLTLVLAFDANARLLTAACALLTIASVFWLGATA